MRMIPARLALTPVMIQTTAAVAAAVQTQVIRLVRLIHHPALHRRPQVDQAPHPHRRHLRIDFDTYPNSPKAQTKYF